jgi:ATP-binding protein involved in chromosome partitioning
LETPIQTRAGVDPSAEAAEDRVHRQTPVALRETRPALGRTEKIVGRTSININGRGGIFAQDAVGDPKIVGIAAVIRRAAFKHFASGSLAITFSSPNMVTEDDIRNALKAVRYPGYSRDVVSFGLVKHVALKDGAVSVTMNLTSANPEAARQIKSESEQVLRAILGVTAVYVEVNQPVSAPTAGAGQTPWGQQGKVPGIRRILAVASGKGGVGKSTMSVNLACALQHLGEGVGLLDCDIYGPSIPLMMGVHQKPTISDEDKMVPPSNYGVKLMSMGLLLEGDQPVIWRGPMIMKTIQQFFNSVEWGQLDYLLVDLPPGTGDAQLTLCQTVPLDGGVIVTTPQEASLGVVRKGIAMFQKVNVPILGIVENMSYFTSPSGDRVEIFGHGGGKAEAMRQNVPFLGEVPIFTEIREGGDLGKPVVVSAPDKAPAAAFLKVAEGLRQKFR